MRDRISIVDINQDKFIVLKYKQYDNNLDYSIIVKEGKCNSDLVGYESMAFFRTPSGKVYNKDCTINGNMITTILDNNILGEYGRVEVEFALHKEGKIATTFTIYFEVEKSIERNDLIKTDPQWDIIKELIDIRNENFQPTLDKLEQQLKDKMEEYDKIFEEIIASEGNHTHLNKPTLDKITEIDLSTWTSASQKVENSHMLTEEEYQEIKSGSSIDLSSYYTSTEVDNKISLCKTDVIEFIDDQIATHQHKLATEQEIDEVINEVIKK